MKQYLLALAATLTTAQIFAQVSEHSLHTSTQDNEQRKQMLHYSDKNISTESKIAFLNDFGDIPGAMWTHNNDNNLDEAVFMQNGQRTTAFYDSRAELVGTVTARHFQDLPQKAQNYINKRLSDWETGSVILFDDNETNLSDIVLYGSNFSDQDNYFILLSKGEEKLVYKADMEGNVSFFKKLGTNFR